MDTAVKSVIALIVIISFVGGSGTMLALTVLGHANWQDIKEMVQAWVGLFSFVVGAVMGHYFKQSDPQKQNTSR